jgi:hypothetical protein
MAAIMPMIATTISSSMSVKPLFSRILMSSTPQKRPSGSTPESSLAARLTFQAIGRDNALYSNRGASTTVRSLLAGHAADRYLVSHLLSGP